MHFFSIKLLTVVLFNFTLTSITLAAPSPISPNGNEANQTPTYTWQSVENTASYTIAMTIASEWREFNISPAEAGCTSINQVCTYTPQETLAIGESFTWYVKTDNESWDDIHDGLNVVIVLPNNKSDIEQFTPHEFSSTKNPWYQWRPSPNASSYTIQLKIDSVIQEFTMTAREARCHSSIHKKCQYRIPGTIFLDYGDNVTWKVKANELHNSFNDGIPFEVKRRTHRYVSQEHQNADNNNLGTRNAPWKTITHALSELKVIDGPKALHIKKGTYKELIEFSDIDHLIIQGELDPSGNILSVIDGSSNTDPFETLPFDTENVYRKGIITAYDSDDLLIQRIAIKNTKRHGIFIESKSEDDIRNVTVQYCLTQNTRGSGILIRGKYPFDQYRFKNVAVKRNSILDPQMGLWPDNKRRIWEEDITLAGGIDIFDISYNTVDASGSDNSYNNSKILDGGPLAIDVKDGIKNGNIHHNTVRNIPSGGIYLDGSSQAGGVYNVAVYANSITNVLGAGIQISGEEGGTVEGALVYNNIITSSYTGLACDNNTVISTPQAEKTVTFRNNTVYDSEIGTWIDDSDSLCKVSFTNNIISTSANKPELYQFESQYTEDIVVPKGPEISHDISYWGVINDAVKIHKNCFHNNENESQQGTGSVTSTDQIFIDATTGNFKLVANSACLGKGVNNKIKIGAE